MKAQVRLPIQRRPEPQPPFPFAVGALVHLVSCPFGAPGRITGFTRGKVLVRWDAHTVTRHKVERLLLADPERAPEGPQMAQDASQGAGTGKTTSRESAAP